MKCEDCPAFCNNAGYEHNADDFWCIIGEDMESGDYDDLGCERNDIEKIKSDIITAEAFNAKAFSLECTDYNLFYAKEEKEKNNEK